MITNGVPTEKLVEDLPEYFALADTSYRRWGGVDQLDPKQPYGLHSGYHEEGTENWTQEQLVGNMTDKIIEELDIQDTPGFTTLENGCGVGHISFNIASRFKNVLCLGTNITTTQVEIANYFAAQYRLQNLHILPANYNNSPIQANSVDRAVFCESLCHSNDQVLSLSDTLRVLKPGGKVFIADVFIMPDQLTNENFQYIKDFQRGWFVQELRSPQEFLQLYHQLGFSSGKLVKDVTPNVMMSAMSIGKRSSGNLQRDQTGVNPLITESRKAAAALGLLMEQGVFVYHWYEFTK